MAPDHAPDDDTGQPSDPSTVRGRSRPRISWVAWVGLTGFVLSLALTTAWLESRAADLVTPRVTLLGSGSSLSVLVTAGTARVLLAAGDDPAAASRALGTALAGGSQRIDLLVVGGTNAGLAVPAAWVNSGRARETVRIGDAHPGRQTGDLPHGLVQLPSDAWLEVAPGVTIEILTVQIPGEQRGDFDLAWRATVRSGQSTVTILSDTRHAVEFDASPSTGILVALRGDDIGPTIPGPAGALVVSAHDVEGSEIRAGLPPLLDRELPVIRVHDGLAVSLRLTPEGAALPPEDVVLIGPRA